MDLKNLLEIFNNNIEVSIIELSSTSKCIFEGINTKFDCKKFEYEVVKFEKNHFDGSYSIVVIKK